MRESKTFRRLSTRVLRGCCAERGRGASFLESSTVIDAHERGRMIGIDRVWPEGNVGVFVEIRVRPDSSTTWMLVGISARDPAKAREGSVAMTTNDILSILPMVLFFAPPPLEGVSILVSNREKEECEEKHRRSEAFDRKHAHVRSFDDTRGCDEDADKIERHDRPSLPSGRSPSVSVGLCPEPLPSRSNIIHDPMIA